MVSCLLLSIFMPTRAGRAVATALKELSNKYEGKLNIFKVVTETELELSEVFGIQSYHISCFL